MRLVASRILGHEILVQRPGQFLVIRNSHKVPPVQVAWKKPESGWIKLNFDGSCKCKSGRSSIGGVFRDHNAEFLLGYSESIGKSNSTIAEIVALRRGLELVLENGWGDNSMWLEGDSKSLVDIIGKREQLVYRCSEVQKHVTHINSIISELNNECILTHVFREGNRVADKFAQMGHHFKNPQVWRHVPPNELLRIVHEDAEVESTEDEFHVSSENDVDANVDEIDTDSEDEVLVSDGDGQTSCPNDGDNVDTSTAWLPTTSGISLVLNLMKNLH